MGKTIISSYPISRVEHEGKYVTLTRIIDEHGEGHLALQNKKYNFIWIDEIWIDEEDKFEKYEQFKKRVADFIIKTGEPMSVQQDLIEKRRQIQRLHMEMRNLEKELIDSEALYQELYDLMYKKNPYITHWEHLSIERKENFIGQADRWLMTCRKRANVEKIAREMKRLYEKDKWMQNTDSDMFWEQFVIHIRNRILPPPKP